MRKVLCFLLLLSSSFSFGGTPLSPEVVGVLRSGSDYGTLGDLHSLRLKGARFHLASKHRELQELVDRLTERYLHTPSSRRLLLVPNEAESLTFELGVSPPVAQRLARSVGNTLPLEFNFQERSYVFVYTAEPFRYWSWTTNERKTLLFLGPNDLTEERVLDLLLHETGVMSDVCLVPTIDIEAQANIDAYGFSPIRFALSALRTFRLERAVLADLGALDAAVLRETPLPRDEKECASLLERVASQSIDLDAVLFRTESREKPTPGNLAPYLAQVRSSGTCMKVLRACNRFFLGGGYNGPRPRVGGD